MRAFCVTGLFYGDEGKGTTVAHLCEELPDVRVVIRHNGGCQAGHNVVTGDGRHHTFSQFGSGMFTPGVRTHLSYRMMVDPYRMYPEAEHLVSLGIPDVWERVSVDRDALVTTPMHAEANFLREQARGAAIHGTCGVGVGETRWAHKHLGEDALFVGDLFRTEEVIRKLDLLFDLYWRELDWALFRPAYTDIEQYVDFVHRVNVIDRHQLGSFIGGGTVIFEGAQGVLLDEKHGFQPHTTWTNTTSGNAREIMQHDLDFDPADAVYIGVTRSYSTRHGAGPFVPGNFDKGEFKLVDFPEPHNASDGHQGVFRQGPWDAAIAEYVREIDQPTHLAVTHCDRIQEAWPLCVGYSENQEPIISGEYGEDARDLISEALGAAILIESHGPRTTDKKLLQTVI